MLKAMSKPQDVLKMFMFGMLKTILKTVLKYEKNTITARVEIERQISFSFGFARVTEVRHVYASSITSSAIEKRLGKWRVFSCNVLVIVNRI